MNPITIDLSGLKKQFGITDAQVNQLTEVCVEAVTAAIYHKWESLAKQQLKATLPEYLSNIIKVDKGRFAKQIVLTGVVPNMVEQGATPFDIKEGFRKSPKVRYTIPKYNAKGGVISAGGDWYLTIPFRIGTPTAIGQVGFSSVMPDEIYNMIRKNSGSIVITDTTLPSPYNIPAERKAIAARANNPYYPSYTHKSSIYAGMTRRTAQYEKTMQNTYGTFRRAGANSDPMSWIHSGIKPHNLAEQAVQKTDVKTIVENEVMQFLETIL